MNCKKTDKDAFDILKDIKTQCINRQLIKEKQLVQFDFTVARDSRVTTLFQN
jgi:hypothetical protein